MSILGKKWLLLNENKKESLFNKLLRNRGVSDPEDFLNPDFEKGLHDPYLLKDMEKAVSRLEHAIENNQKILIVGDYDVDGISATALLLDYLLKVAKTDVSYRLPSRLDEGYGLNMGMVEEAKKAGVSLLITVDNGISSFVEIKELQAAGIDVIVTDHHALPEQLPPAYAIIHSLYSKQYPFKELSGVAVAYKLLQALVKKSLEEKEAEAYLKWALDLVALGTVADCVPLKGENRVLTKFGLKVLEQTKRAGLKALFDLSRYREDTCSTETIAFYLAPRLNAAGRLESANLSVELLLTDDPKQASEIAKKLENLNKERQELTEKLISLAERGLRGLDKKIIVSKHPKFHAGVVGLVAGRLAEKYNLPAVVLEEGKELLTASCRSPEGFNIVEAISRHADLLDRFGGHAQAAGFTVLPKNFKELQKSLEEFAVEILAEKDLRAQIRIDSELGEEELNFELVKSLNALEPFGMGNEQPIFLIRDLNILRIQSVGLKGKHLKLSVSKNGKNLSVIGFKLGDKKAHLSPGMQVDLVGHLEINQWNGESSLQIKLLDFAVKG